MADRTHALGPPGPCLVHAILMAGALLMVLPMLWMVATSFKPAAEIADLAAAPACRRRRRCANYSGIFEVAPFARFFLNSVGISVVATLERRASPRWSPAPSSPSTASPAAALLFALIIATAIVPFESYMIPLYLQLNAIELDQHLSGHRPALSVHELRHLPDAPARRVGDPDRAARGGARRRRVGVVDPAPG